MSSLLNYKTESCVEFTEISGSFLSSLAQVTQPWNLSPQLLSYICSRSKSIFSSAEKSYVVYYAVEVVTRQRCNIGKIYSVGASSVVQNKQMTFNVDPVLITFFIFNISSWIRHATLKFWNVLTPATLQIKLILAFFCAYCRICQFLIVGYGMDICRSFSNGVTPINCMPILNGITKSSNARRVFAIWTIDG